MYEYQVIYLWNFLDLLSEQKELLQTTQKDVTDKYKQLKSVAEALDVALQESADGVASIIYYLFIVIIIRNLANDF